MAISIYTDGSALAKRGHKSHMRGGCAVVFCINNEIKKTISKGYTLTKIGRMELTAILIALKVLAKDQKATIYSDSMYCVNSFNKRWLQKWEHQNWIDLSKEKGKRLNADILKQLLEEYRKFPRGAVKFKHIRGHQGNEFNEKADELASYRNFVEFEKDLVLTDEEKKVEGIL